MQITVYVSTYLAYHISTIQNTLSGINCLHLQKSRQEEMSRYGVKKAYQREVDIYIFTIYVLLNIIAYILTVADHLIARHI